MLLNGTSSGLSRRALLSALGVPALAACTPDQHGLFSPKLTRTAEGWPQWISSADLISEAGRVSDLAALSKAAGLVTGAPTRDPHGPYLPLELPANHPIMQGVPESVDPRLKGALNEDAFAAMVRHVAPFFVRHIVDGEVIWSHDRKLFERWVARFMEVTGSSSDTPRHWWGKLSVFNTDGKYAERVLHTPRRRREAVVRTGVVRLGCKAVADHRGEPAAELRALVRTAVDSAHGPEADMDMSLVVGLDGEGWQHVGVGTVVGHRVARPTVVLPQLQLKPQVPEGWRRFRMGALTVWHPPTFTVERKTEAESADMMVWRHRAGHAFLEWDPWGQPDEHLVQPKRRYTQFTIPGGARVIASWGPSFRHPARVHAVIHAPTGGAWTVALDTPRGRELEELRHHAQTWRLTG